MILFFSVTLCHDLPRAKEANSPFQNVDNSFLTREAHAQHELS